MPALETSWVVSCEVSRRKRKLMHSKANHDDEIQMSSLVHIYYVDPLQRHASPGQL